MYIVTAKITRPNTLLSWYIMSDPMVSPVARHHWKTAYKETQKCVFVDVSISENELEMTNVIYWDTAQSYLDYKQDSVFETELFPPRDTYWAQNNMVYQIVSESEA